MNDVVKVINSNDKSTVSASVVSSGGVNHLILTAKESGTEHAVNSIQVTDNNDLGTLLNFEQDVAGSSLTETAAVTAKYSINGIEVESQSNTSTAIGGITLTLSEVIPADKPLTLTVNRDTEASAKAIQSSVTAYNALQTTISNSTTFDTTALTQGALNGDSTTRVISKMPWRPRYAYQQALVQCNPCRQSASLLTPKPGCCQSTTTISLKL